MPHRIIARLETFRDALLSANVCQMQQRVVHPSVYSCWSSSHICIIIIITALYTQPTHNGQQYRYRLMVNKCVCEGSLLWVENGLETVLQIATNRGALCVGSASAPVSSKYRGFLPRTPAILGRLNEAFRMCVFCFLGKPVCYINAMNVAKINPPGTIKAYALSAWIQTLHQHQASCFDALLFPG